MMVKKRYFYQSVVMLIMLFLLMGFIFYRPAQEIDDFIKITEKELKESYQLELPPIPQIEVYKSFVYKANKQDPFKLLSFVTGIENGKGEKLEDRGLQCVLSECGDPPPLEHYPYILERYELSNLSMVGVIKSKFKQKIVLIKTPDSNVIKTKVGEYIGRNNGVITRIEDDHIVVKETYKVPRGWQNRTTTLELFN